MHRTVQHTVHRIALTSPPGGRAVVQHGADGARARGGVHAVGAPRTRVQARRGARARLPGSEHDALRARLPRQQPLLRRRRSAGCQGRQALAVGGERVRLEPRAAADRGLRALRAAPVQAAALARAAPALARHGHGGRRAHRHVHGTAQHHRRRGQGRAPPASLGPAARLPRARPVRARHLHATRPDAARRRQGRRRRRRPAARLSSAARGAAAACRAGGHRRPRARGGGARTGGPGGVAARDDDGAQHRPRGQPAVWRVLAAQAGARAGAARGAHDARPARGLRRRGGADPVRRGICNAAAAMAAPRGAAHRPAPVAARQPAAAPARPAQVPQHAACQGGVGAAGARARGHEAPARHGAPAPRRRLLRLLLCHARRHRRWTYANVRAGQQQRRRRQRRRQRQRCRCRRRHQRRCRRGRHHDVAQGGDRAARPGGGARVRRHRARPPLVPLAVLLVRRDALLAPALAAPAGAAQGQAAPGHGPRGARRAARAVRGHLAPAQLEPR
eukprot:scaffold22244_cov62-Phaeocystis_antarctica.AAC.4